MNEKLFEFMFRLAHQSTLLDGVGVFFASYLQYFLVIGFVFFLFTAFRDWRRRLFVFCESMLAIMVSRGIITELIRLIFPHERPFDALGIQSLISESGNSFPSGHAAFFFALAVAMWYFNKKWGISFFVLAFVMGVARVFSGVHWPFDVAGGMVVGVLSAYFAHALLRPYWEEFQKKTAAA